jgi:hypothetical protein
MKTQAQFYNNETAMEYWEQYFETQTPIQITLEQWFEIKQMLDDLTRLLSEGNKVDVIFKIIEEKK